MLNRHINILGLLLVNISFAQIIHPPVFTFERLEWGTDINQAQEIIGDKHLKEINSDEYQFGKNDNQTKYLMYFDTLFSEIVGVGLGFSKINNLLVSIGITYLGIDPDTKEQYLEIEIRLENLSKYLTDHYGQPQTVKNVPFVGKVSRWTHSSTNIQLFEMTGLTKMMSITYKPNYE